MAAEQSYSAADSLAISTEATAEAAWPAAGDNFWHASAPSGVRRHYVAGDSAGGWKRWRRHLLGRSGTALAAELTEKLAGGRKKAGGALAWGAVRLSGDNHRLDWLSRLSDARPRRARELATLAPVHVEEWLTETADLQRWAPSVDAALEAVAWARALAALGRVCSGEMWWQLIERLHHLAQIGSMTLENSVSADPLANQLACGELPWTLAALFSETVPCRQLASAAAKTLSKGIADLLDGAGLPHGRHLSIFHRLVACWTRCRILAAAVRSASAKSVPDECRESDSTLGACWDDDAEQEFFQAVREALRLTRNDGTPVLSNLSDGDLQPVWGASVAWLSEIAAGLIVDGDKHDRRSMATIAAGRGGKKARGRNSKRPPKHLPDAAVFSEWAELAVMQADWSLRSARLTVAYPGCDVRIELQSDRELLLSGVWEFEVRADGALAGPKDTWSEVCWVSDADCDYLELEIKLNRSIRIQRQILLSRKDQFLLLADAVLGDEPRELVYRGQLPLAAEIAIRPAHETRELTLAGKHLRAVVLPLELPEWLSDRRRGSLVVEEAGHGRLLETAIEGTKANHASTNGAATHTATNGAAAHTATNGAATNGMLPNNSTAIGAAAKDARPPAIVLNQSLYGCRLFAPLWIDLSTKRARNLDRDPLTWRQLTVGEQRQIAGRDQAVGYRVQCGEQQWVAYRSLAAPANRTLLGVNLSTDFFVGRFGSNGETASIVEIE